MPKLVLASASPRRKALLAPFLDLEIEPADIDENIPSSATLDEAKKIVMDLAIQKAIAVANGDNVVLAADTLGVCNGRVLGKPRDRDDARRMLAALSDDTHYVVTGLAITDGRTEHSSTVVSAVTFKNLTSSDIEGYLDIEDYQDKAASYAIQSEGWRLVENVEGSWTNIVGLPLKETKRLLALYHISMDMPQKIIVVVGMPGAGKEEFVNIARQRLYAVVRMGDVVREEATHQGIDTTDTGIGGFATSQRKEHGAEVWALRTLKALENLDSPFIVVDGSRSPAEIKAFKDSLGDAIKVVSITTSQEIRYERLKSRGRSDAPKNFEAFKARDDRERGWGIGKALELADTKIPNESTLKELQSLVQHYLDRLERPI